MRNFLLPAALVLASVSASAQVQLTWSGGVLGGSVTYDMVGPAGKAFGLIPSFEGGPTPLAIFDPLDPRSLDVGFDLIDYVQIGVFATPNASITLPLPAIGIFSGFDLHAQVVTFDFSGGASTLIDDISNPAVFTMGLTDDVLPTRSDVLVARQGHTATLLADGRVLIAGGDVPNISGVLSATDSFEIYDPQTQTFGGAGTMTQARSTHTATLLSDGRVLLSGGYANAVTSIGLATAEIFDPLTGTTSLAASPPSGRTLHTATLMGDGRVLVVGGSAKFDLNDLLGSLATVKKATALYDPVADSWSNGPNLPAPLFAHQASLLGDGTVLISSGVEIAFLFSLPLPGVTSDCHRFDPVGNQLLPTASMPSGRAYHGQITLPNGDAMAVGGATGNFVSLNFSVHTDTYIFNYLANSWSNAAPINVGRAYPNLVRTSAGVAVLSGLKTVDVTTGSGTPATAIETAPLDASTWNLGGVQNLPREVARAVTTGERVLIVGVGDNGTAAVDQTAEVFIP